MRRAAARAAMPPRVLQIQAINGSLAGAKDHIDHAKSVLADVSNLHLSPSTPTSVEAANTAAKLDSLLTALDALDAAVRGPVVAARDSARALCDELAGEERAAAAEEVRRRKAEEHERRVAAAVAAEKQRQDDELEAKVRAQLATTGGKR